ncbi:hypothetical protein [Longispora urticae]
MSQEERDARLGLTGLTPEQRRQRIEELERQIAESTAVARAALERVRSERAAADGPADPAAG